MAATAILILCAQALLIQSALSQCLERAGLGAPYGWAGRNWGYNGLGYSAGYGWGYNSLYDYPAIGFCCSVPLDFSPTSGSSLVVTSASAIPPIGISIVSDNAFESTLTAVGEVPFVGTTGMEGGLPTVGAGAINYGCGTGTIAMVTDFVSPVGSSGSALDISTISPDFGDCGCVLVD